ncbi:pentalenene synthase, partial [Streptomyces sp. NPDC021100]
MPLDVVFDIPFPPGKVNPDYERAGQQSLEWLRSLAVIGSGQAAADFKLMKLAESTALAYPDAEGDDLDVVSDLNYWFGLYDFMFDNRQGHASQIVEPTCLGCLAVIEGGPLAAATHTRAPMVAALADVWSRLITGMSRYWQARVACDLRGF